MLSRTFLLFFIGFAVGRTATAAPATLLAAPDAPDAPPSSLSKDCYTRKTKDGDCCVFPFKYQGKTFDDCTTKNLGMEWCATTDNYDTDPSEWGLCAGKTPKIVFDQILESNQNSSGKANRFAQGIELFEGDIVVDDDIRRRFLNKKGSPGRTKRAAKRGKRTLWLDSSGRPLIPYEIQPSNYHARGVIQRAMNHLKSKVPCLRFVQHRRGMRGRYLSFHNGGGCWSMVGRTSTSGRQLISIGNGCQYMGVVAHEIGHALGFWHEQSRPDRDRYVRINWQNIQSGAAFNFKKQTHAAIDSLGVPYDYKSVMHYGSRAFTRPGVRGYTIVGINGRTDLGQRYGLAASDALQLNKMYCGSGPKPPPPPPPTPPPPGCNHHDNHRWCPFWKSKGYCSNSSHSSFMRRSCKKSCFCRDLSCKDKKPADCPGWQRSGYCTHSKYGQYVKTYCRKTCKLC